MAFKKLNFHYFTAILCFSVTTSAIACPICHTAGGEALRLALYNHNFYFVMAVIFFIFTCFVVSVFALSYRLTVIYVNKKSSFALSKLRKLLAAGMLLGGSSAGFCDGIIFHQILQTHSMIANKLPLTTVLNLEVNMFWDGIFHSLTLATGWLGIIYFWQALNHKDHHYTPDLLFGCFLLGAGIFNLIEGMIDHQFLQLHHVLQNSVPSAQLNADIIFIIVALLLIIVGWRMIKSFFIFSKNNSV